MIPGEPDRKGMEEGKGKVQELETGQKTVICLESFEVKQQQFISSVARLVEAYWDS